MFGVLNGSSGADFPSTIPASVLPGSIALTNLYRDYFVSQSLPWDGKQFNGRSDYGSFLTAGIPAGGVSAFIDRLKTMEERDRYNAMLGPGMGGIPNIAIGPFTLSTHQHCHSFAVHPHLLPPMTLVMGCVCLSVVHRPLLSSGQMIQPRASCIHRRVLINSSSPC